MIHPSTGHEVAAEYEARLSAMRDRAEVAEARNAHNLHAAELAESRLAEANAEIAKWREEFDNAFGHATLASATRDEAIAERDAALARADAAERERDALTDIVTQWEADAAKSLSALAQVAQERDQARAELADHMAGNMQLRTILGARDNETMFCVVERVAAALSKANGLIVAYTEACNSVPDMSEDFGGVADEREWACGEIERTQTSLHDHGRALIAGAAK